MMRPLSFAWLFFLASRFFIIFRYKLYISDVKLFYLVAQTGILRGRTAYHDFFFPYPPLALPFVYAPIYFGRTFESFRLAFQFEMFAVDALCLWVTVMFLKKRLLADEKRAAAAVALYSVLGLLTGHLLYDRLDVVVGLSFMLMMYFFGSSPAGAYASAFTGSLFKLMPIVWYPVSMIAATFDKKKGALTGPWLRPLAVRLVKFALPFAFVLYLYDAAIGGGLGKHLLEHGERGIQIESIWAVPFMLKKALGSGGEISLESR